MFAIYSFMCVINLFLQLPVMVWCSFDAIGCESKCWILFLGMYHF